MSAQVLVDRGQKVQLANSQPNDTQPGDSAINDDELEADPDLQAEVEIDLPREVSTAGRSRKTMSRKSNVSKISEKDSVRIVKSRSRPMKPHETEPFLSINNLPPDKTFISEKSHRSSAPSRQSSKGHSVFKNSASVPLQRLAAYMSPYSQAMPMAPSPSVASGHLARPRSSQSIPNKGVNVRPGSRAGSRAGLRPGSKPGSRPGSKSGHRNFPSRNGQITPTNTPFQSPVKQLKAPNHHVKSPFKHAVSKPDMLPDGRTTPATELKERTALATFHVSRMMAGNREKEEVKSGGQLKKGKLKPMYPVDMSGPDISKCRGIVSETRSYGASPSRTLQRRLNLVSKIPNVHEYLYDRPRTVESVHQTSVASSVDENHDNQDFDDDDDHFDSNRSLPDEILYTTPMTRSATMRSYTQDPIITEGNTINTIPTVQEDTPRFITEVNTKDSDKENVKEMVAKQLQEVGVDLGKVEEVNKENINSNSRLEQPGMTDDIQKSGEMDTTDLANRIRSPSKSVRFAVNQTSESSTEPASGKDQKQQTNSAVVTQHKGRQKSPETKRSKLAKNDLSDENKRSKGKQSCRPENDNDEWDSRNDGDDDGSGNGRNITHNGTDLSASRERNSGNSKGDNSNGNNNTPSDTTGVKEQKRAVTGPDEDGRSANRSRRGQHCSRFELAHSGHNSPVSLQVQALLHGDVVHTTLGSSPDRARSRSRSQSPCRQVTADHKPYRKCYSSTIQSENCDRKCEAFVRHCQDISDMKSEFQFFNSVKTKKLYGEEDDCLDYFSQRTKVKFFLEGEDPERETIFIENEGEHGVSIQLREDRQITFEALESELESLQVSIQDKLKSDVISDTLNLLEISDDKDIEIAESLTERSGTKTQSSETMKGDYSVLLSKYRRRCMERSEKFGAFSERLATPRRSSSRGRDSVVFMAYDPLTETSCQEEKEDTIGEQKSEKFVSNSGVEVSDSGHGSEDNTSELSRTASTATLVPRLDLEGSMSDLGLGTEHSDVTEDGGKNLLEMMCEELPPPIVGNLKKEAKEKTEDDVSKLKVIATSKSISKSKVARRPWSCQPVASFPPLCFTVNARPPTGFVYVFMYGPDMNPDRFNTYVHRQVKNVYWAILFGFSLIFNKKGLSAEAGGFANLEFNPLRSVEGCLYQITQEEVTVLDQCVGYPKYYEHLVLPVWMSNNTDPDCYGVAQYCVPALIYIAQDEWTDTENQLNCDYSVSQCLKTDKLTPEYRKSLITMSTSQIQVTA